MFFRVIRQLNTVPYFETALNSFVVARPFCSISSVFDIPNSTKSSEYVTKLFEGLLLGQRSSLATAITLVESIHPKRREEARILLKLALEHSGNRYKNEGQNSLSFRIGLTGPPGAGKSTLIERIGKLLTGKGHKVAVLTVDPSSSTTGGSILGDKTRMIELSRDNLAYVRPSPSSGCLGGVTRSTNEAIVLCECAGYNVVIVETVGVGQSEIDVAEMVDMFVLIVPPAGGDELQALKKGIIELVDMIVVNKADGDLLPSALRIQAEYVSALKFIIQRTKTYKPQVLRISAQMKDGIDSLWDEMNNFRNVNLKSGELELKRKKQYKSWMWRHIENHLLSTFKSHLTVKACISAVEQAVQESHITPSEASDYLMKKFLTCHSCGTSI